jgi:nucleoside-diphosphate-sugar epimerase
MNQRKKTNLMDRVLVTGGTGFLGHNLVKALRDEFPDIKINVLSRNKLETIPSFYGNASFHYADITNTEALEKAMEGCNVVFHACGDTRWWDMIEDEQVRTNILGSIAVCDAAKASPTVHTLVHTSTVDVLGHSDTCAIDDIEILTKDTPYSYKGWEYAYADSKRAAELAVSEYAGNDLKIRIIRPGSMIGPWDVTNQYGRVFEELRSGSMFGYPPGATSWCDVRAVAKAHIKAAQLEGDDLQVFNCAGVNAGYAHVFDLMGKHVTTTPPTHFIPGPILVAYGWLCELYSTWWSYKHPEINPGMARYMSIYAFYKSDRAIETLEYEPGTLEDMIQAAYEWYDKVEQK